MMRAVYAPRGWYDGASAGPWSGNAAFAGHFRDRALLAQSVEHFHGKRIRRPMAEARAGAELAGLQRFPGAVASSVTSSSAVGFGPSLPRVQYQRSMGAPASRGRESAVIPSRMRSGPRGWCPGVPHAVIDAESTIR
jgi:hypothetical protein